MNYYKRHLGDLAKSCGDLSQGEMGAYDLLMDWLYANEKPIPSDPKKFYRIARATTKAERANVDSVLRDLFDLTDDGYIQKRVMEEIEHAEEVSESARKSANARWGKSQSEDDAKRMRNACETQSVRNASHYSNTPRAKEQELPPTAGKEPPDPIFGTGLALLMRKGVPEKPARSFLGKFRRDVGDDLKASALLAKAETDDISEPLAWLAKAAKARASTTTGIAQQFADKTYTGTPDDELPDYLRPH